MPDRSRQPPRSLRGFVFDVDGTLVLHDQSLDDYAPIAGAVEVLDELRQRGIPFVCFTNGTSHTPQGLARRLRATGLAVEDHEVMTPSSVAAKVLSGHRRVLVLGGEGVAEPLSAAGIEIVRPPSIDCDAVYVGWHRDVAWPDLESVIRAAAAGVPIYASSIATYFATRAGPAIGMSGAIVAMVRGVTGKRARLVGKPSRAALRAAAERLRVPASAIAVVGDDLALEIAMARAGGAAAVAVRTGLADAAAIGRLPESAAPHLVLQSVQDLLPLLDELIGSDHS